MSRKPPLSVRRSQRPEQRCPPHCMHGVSYGIWSKAVASHTGRQSLHFQRLALKSGSLGMMTSRRTRLYHLDTSVVGHGDLGSHWCVACRRTTCGGPLIADHSAEPRPWSQTSTGSDLEVVPLRTTSGPTLLQTTADHFSAVHSKPTSLVTSLVTSLGPCNGLQSCYKLVMTQIITSL